MWKIVEKVKTVTIIYKPVQPYRNLSQTEMWNIISYWYTFSKFVELICLRNLQYTTGVEELLKCGGKEEHGIIVQFYRNFVPTVNKSSTNWNVEDNFISEYIYEICST